MRKPSFIFRIFLSLCVLFATLQSCPNSYSQDVEELANNIADSYKFFEEGKDFYKKHDYVNAKIKFQQSLVKDPGNKKAKKFLKLCNRKIEKQEKQKKRLRKRKKARLERKAWGIFGVKKKALKMCFLIYPQKTYPEKN